MGGSATNGATPSSLKCREDLKPAQWGYFRSKFNLPLINILWRVASSEQFEYDDPKLINLLEKVAQNIDIVPVFIFFFPASFTLTLLADAQPPSR